MELNRCCVHRRDRMNDNDLEDEGLLPERRFNEGGNAIVGRDIAHVDEDFHVGEQRWIPLDNRQQVQVKKPILSGIPAGG